MKLIVGLGNPGKEYENTRHNVGFMIVDSYAEQYHTVLTKRKFDGLYGEIIIHGEKVILLKPQKYMNLSGEVVKQYVQFFKIPIADVLIVHDDLDLPIGIYKWKAKGSSGGHNGLKNIEFHLGTQDYKRLKVGISNHKQLDTKDYVLGHFSKEEMQILNLIIKKSLSMLDEFLELSFLELMNRYNGNK